MKRVLLLILGYYLILQAAIAALNALGRPEYLIPIGALAALSGWAGYKLITLARASRKLQETK